MDQVQETLFWSFSVRTALCGASLGVCPPFFPSYLLLFFGVYPVAHFSATFPF
jgi:hypothetical protein